MSKSHDLLGLEPNCGSAAVKERWRELASIYHPDRGGDPGEFSAIREAYKKAFLYEENLESVCKECNGTKKVSLTAGFNQIFMPCPVCQRPGKYK